MSAILFELTAGNSIHAQVELAAEWGFAAFCDPGLLQRPRNDRLATLNAMLSRGLMIAPPRGPAAQTAADLRRWTHDVVRAMDQLAGWNLSGLRVDYGPLTHEWTSSGADFRRVWRTQLARLADSAQRRKLVIFLEPWDDGRAGLDAFTSAAECVLEMQHPALRLSMDTYGLAAAGFDLASIFAKYAHMIGHVELADFPGGCEPGTGALPIVTCLRHLLDSGYAGVIGLRHGNSQPGPAGERAVRRACDKLRSRLGGGFATSVV
ncbi:MAG: hypothetical protein B7Z55_02775 [Planctomycetales bacterium 12-60-4]|nr:MAG: hypothetical protein B7Z55_02775 [Planctomycetales bacterium 12-60-4]